MKGSQDEVFKTELKQLIIEECDLDISPQDIPDDDPLFGEASCIGLDSIDALQISIAIQKRYGVVITDSKELRQVMTSFASFADHIRPE
jgi:acyl carrier protein